jgi:hypothetical protein
MQEKFWKKRSTSRSKSSSKSIRFGGRLCLYTKPIMELFNSAEALLMLKSEQNDEECDATKADSSIKADYILIKVTIINR